VADNRTSDTRSVKTRTRARYSSCCQVEGCIFTKKAHILGQYVSVHRFQ
jgi:hypothetical protein